MKIPNAQEVDPSKILNINIGILGHVDSGKTSLVKTLSTLLSTASLDKSSQSRQRGITLDLGFSAFLLPLPDKFYEIYHDLYDFLQITLVDCPGHASLIKTIIGGAQIIDMIILVVDATKGIQTQTKECLVIAELTTRDLVVALNKIDLLESSSNSSSSSTSKDSSSFEEKLSTLKSNIHKTLSQTVFQNVPMVEISAAVGGEKVAALQSILPTKNIDALVNLIQTQIKPPLYRANCSSPSEFNFSIDHCFPIKGKGTVITGTVLSGSTKINSMIEFPHLGLQRKIKTMQMFKKSVQEIQIGDRAGICISNFDANLLERGIACSPNTVQHFRSAIVICRKVRFFKGTLLSESKFHVTVGHSTVMATMTFFGAKEIRDRLEEEETKSNNRNEENSTSFGRHADVAGLPKLPFSFDQDFIQQHEMIETLENNDNKEQSKKKKKQGEIEMPVLNWAILEFQTPIYCPMTSLIIGSRLDTDIQTNNTCRLAFSGRMIQHFDSKQDMGKLRIYNNKEKIGIVSRLSEAYRRKSDDAIVRFDVFGADLFKKETNMTPFLNMIIHTDNENEVGYIHSSFGTGGKFKVYFPTGTTVKKGDKLYLRFKRYLHDNSKAMHQDVYKFPSRVDAIKVEATSKKKPKEKIVATGEITKIKEDLIVNNKATVVIVTGFFTQEDNIKEKVGMKVLLPKTKEEGKVSAAFGKAGKCKVTFENGVSIDCLGQKVQLMSPNNSNG